MAILELRPLERPPMPPTRPVARAGAVLGYVAALVIWIHFIGIPNDPVGVLLWFWLFTVAWHVDAPRERHLDFARDWWRPVLLFTGYWLLRGIADNTGMPVHISAPVRMDEWLGGGTTPTELLQHKLCGDPCIRDSAPRWYDVLLTTVYASHFWTALLIGGVLWMRNRAEWLLWMRRYLTMLYAGALIYFAYPMAPPWMASKLGVIGEVHRMSGRGWSELGLHRQSMVLMGMPNKVAAMPSLHAGIAFLVAFYAVSRLRSHLRWLLLLYPVAMSTALVYGGEHYVVDTIAGALVAGLVLIGCAAFERSRHPTHDEAR
ncbi:phosphatase PAP2 family protein [Nocardioides jensenii]|uniref:phosphatase PAP2 family protein n=1 Tax=Nocardioides jensenii TaxID=1843 RepID=UPI00082FE965|nr:phosphatase PAP2 family protein [Nocardioides jensenii]